MTSAGDLRGEDQECSSDQEHGRKETPTGDSRRPQGRFAGTRAGGHLKMFQDLRPASGNLPEGRLSSSPAPGKSFEQKREERSHGSDESDQNLSPIGKVVQTETPRM